MIRRMSQWAKNSESGSMSAAATADLRLVCRPGKIGNVLTFPYTLENLGQTDLYVMHALPGVDPASRAARADDQAAVVILGADGDAILGKFAAPLPTDRRIAVPVLPLARRLPAGAKLESRLDLLLPLAETSPYFPDLTLRQYEMVEIRGVVFTIGYWPAGIDNLVAAPVDYAPDLFTVVTRNTFKSAARITQRFATTGLFLFKRSDPFPRSLG
jgi:hypothetical protein